MEKSYIGKMPTTTPGSQTHSNSALEKVKSILGFFLIRFIGMIILNTLIESEQRMYFTFHPNNSGDMWPLISIS